MSVGSDIRADLLTSAASVKDTVVASMGGTDSLSTSKDCSKTSKRLKRLRSRRTNEEKQSIEEGLENSQEVYHNRIIGQTESTFIIPYHDSCDIVSHHFCCRNSN